MKQYKPTRVAGGKFAGRELIFNEDLGTRPEMTWLPLEHLMVDRNYQRDAIPIRIRKIAAAFNWRFFQPPTVTKIADNLYAVIDGQHRVSAAKLHPKLSEVPCYIVEAPEVREQAQSFITTNRERTAVTPLALFWAGVTAQDSECLRVMRVAEEAGIEIQQGSPGFVPPKTTCAISALRKCVRVYGDAATTLALKAIVTAQPDTKNAFAGQFVLAVTKLVSEECERIEFDRLVVVLGEINIARFSADALVTARALGGATEKAMRIALVKAYNKGFVGRDGRRLEMAA